jgi:hypothetical protein
MMDLLDEHETDLGKCCICEGVEGVRNVIVLDFMAPVAPEGEIAGWGCFVCKLPTVGAIAVLCDHCLETYQKGNAKIKYIVVGYAYKNKRVPLEGFEQIPFKHDMSKHPEAWSLNY